MTYTEAIAVLEQRGPAFSAAVKWGMDLQREHERWLCEVHTGGVPLFVTDYPRWAVWRSCYVSSFVGHGYVVSPMAAL